MGRRKEHRFQTGNPVSAQPRRVSNRPTNNGTMTTSSAMLADDAASFVHSFGLGVELLMQDLPCCSPDVSGGWQRLLNSVVAAGDFLGFIDACATLRTELVQGVSWSACVSKHTRRRWVRGLDSAIRHTIPGNLIVHPSVAFDRVVTFLGWLKRLPICIRSTEESVDAYYECDRRLSSIDFDDNVYVHALASIWHEWFHDFVITQPFEPRHGSGSTADCGRVRSRKWRSLAIDVRASVLLRDARLEKLVELPIRPVTRTSKVKFVPKQAGKDRTICMEPAWLQFLQQGVARQLIRFTHSTRHPLAKFVNIFSQERNRELCAWGVERGLATIDLSDASDSVSRRLIRRLCGRLPLYRYLLASSSTTVNIDGRIIKMDKFAPMGSALCFPIECYVFASIVELAFRMHYGRASSGFHDGCQVYGDDIICPVEIYHLVVVILQSLGFVVNEAKSFCSGPYRESCGVEYLHGVLINTIKHPRHHLLCREDGSPERIGMITDLANSMRTHGYFRARRALLKANEDCVIRVGSRTYRLMDLIRFDEKHCVPLVEPYVETFFSTRWWRRCRRVRSCDSVTGRASSDYVQWTWSHPPRSRGERIMFADRKPQDFPIGPNMSRKAIVCLCRFGFPELMDPDYQIDVGRERTGQLRYTVKTRVIAV